MKLINNLKKIFNKENKTLLVGLLSIIIVLWVILYVVPEIFASLFNSILGNFILLICVILVSTYNTKWGLLLALIIVILFRFAYFFSLGTSKEGFSWTTDSQNDFVNLQTTINRNVIFDINELQKQASQDEVNYFLQNGKWPWSEKTKFLYAQSAIRNPYIRNNPMMLMTKAQTIYNETAMLRLLSFQSKEANFLLSGVTISGVPNSDTVELPSGYGSFAHNSGLQKPRNPIVKCGQKSDGKFVMQQTNYTGFEGIMNTQTRKVVDLDNNDLETAIPGFKFVNEPCNPCGALNDPPDYSCPFTIDLSGNNQLEMSLAWQTLWGIPIDPLKSIEEILQSGNANPYEYPLLNEFKSKIENLFGSSSGSQEEQAFNFSK